MTKDSGQMTATDEAFFRANDDEIRAEQHKKVIESLWQMFGCRPDEKNGEKWIVYRDHNLIVIHPERRPRIYKRGCGGVYYEFQPDFPSSLAFAFNAADMMRRLARMSTMRPRGVIISPIPDDSH